jgi:hypothetical protein
MNRPFAKRTRAILFMATSSPLGLGSEEPPSSLVPPAESVMVRVSLELRMTRECHGSGAGKQPSCLAREEARPGKTTITLIPVPPASLKGRHPTRTPVTWSLDAADPNVGNDRSLAPGLWRLEWRGYSRQPTFRADAGASLQILLRVKRGRCELFRGECRLEPSAVERQAEIRAL